MNLKKTLSICLASLFLAVGARAADPYPSKPVNLMVPYPAGGSSDVIARVIHTPLSRLLGQPVLVENLGGAGGAIGAQKVLNAPSDGYYLFQGSSNETILVPLANAAIKYKSDDFRLIQMIGVAPMVLMARKDLPANDMDEFIALARSASPTKPLTFGSVGYGSLYHMLGEHLAERLGATMTHVPYKGGAPLMQDLGAGTIDFMLAPIQQQLIGMTESGRLKIIGTLAPSGKTEVPMLKNFPSVNDSKGLKDFSFHLWHGYFVRKDTPEEVVQRLHAALNTVLADPAVRSQLEAQGLMMAPATTLAEASRGYAAEAGRLRAIAKSIKLEAK
ncbi:Bug family tripartite tricarboxylate transporter substrate binding protein [Variovorax saccharolyticus]|uniref:Bug family tripartite tricarboxylate transporter substrate binding protein n=1 Tax=Variovorax saccharolyticus TaxID=3053516 RepID=UPI002577C19B|nr:MULTISPECIES: tripartite tricarboxylate transporter substrate binding protein [unclassified Variovorax]MDM0017379.1 tripartite tricarboxylate transporter substrate binding protein [Variovorax sp. J22R187]MDM0026897.1 tripartite tricarboxylate transporter substrate binding protein [Variovorax sp. J31P216]